MKLTKKFDQIKEKLSELEELQDSLQGEYGDILEEFEANDFAMKYEKASQELEIVKKKLKDASKENADLKELNFDLRLALKEQVISERKKIVNISRQKLDNYFKKEISSSENELDKLKFEIENKIEKITKRVNNKAKDNREELLEEIASIYRKLDGEILAEKQSLSKFSSELANEMKLNFNELASQELDDEKIKEQLNKNKLEVKFGLNILNKIGVVLILLGVVAAMKYSYSNWFNDYIKGIFAFLLGGVFLGGGEYFFRKENKTFSLGLLGGGIGILYSSIFYSFFLLKIISMPVALMLAVVITVLSILLSLRYESPTICAISLLGGYLPVISYYYSYSLTQEIFNYILFYIALLNIVVLIIAVFRKWIVISYISFFLHLPAMLTIIYEMKSTMISILYVSFSFVLYMVITLIYPIRYRMKLSNYDRALTIINTLLSFSILYGLFERSDSILKDYTGILVIGFAIVYFLLGQLITKKLEEKSSTILIYYGTALAFAVLAIPVQLGSKWLSLGWLAESLIIIYYSVRLKQKKMSYAGFVIFFLCLVSFYTFDFTNVFDSYEVNLTMFKYSSIMFGQLFILYIMYSKLMVKSDGELKFRNAFKIFTLITLWFYEIAAIIYLFDKVKKFTTSSFADTVSIIMIAFITIVTAYVADNLETLKSRFTKAYSYVLYLLAIFMCIMINTFSSFSDRVNIFEKIIMIVLIFVLNIFIVMFMRNTMKKVSLSLFRNIEFYPIFFTLLILTNSISVMVGQFNIEGYSLFISLFVLLISLVCIYIGFRKGYRYLRIFGLALSVITTAKTFFFDLAFLQSTMKIAAYFGFGITLLLISFIYQKMKEKLEVKI